MFEKEAMEYAVVGWDKSQDPRNVFVPRIDETKFNDWRNGAEFGYNKANEWHYVKDGDLPKDENDVLVYSGEDWRMCVGKYFPKYKAWEAGCDVIAWCEIPKYTEE